MSKLDSFIRRMTTQRDCLNHAARLIAEAPGPVLELGLGNGRTYDHLREILPDRDIYVFDRRINALQGCSPPRDRTFLGEIGETLPHAAAFLVEPAALAHVDLGTSDDEHTARLFAMVAGLLCPLMAPGSVIVSNFEMPAEGWERISEPPGVKPGKCFLYRVR